MILLPLILALFQIQTFVTCKPPFKRKFSWSRESTAQILVFIKGVHCKSYFSVKPKHSVNEGKILKNTYTSPNYTIQLYGHMENISAYRLRLSVPNQLSKNIFITPEAFVWAWSQSNQPSFELHRSRPNLIFWFIQLIEYYGSTVFFKDS